ncbi:MAG: cupin-like domain-containing protein [Gammaproteobacteria bacterium]|nr:cupin-like domain-containing protein [Gammaproteobacteria bacterium]
MPQRPAVISGAIDHWVAMGKWTPDFFRQHYQERVVKVDGEKWRLGELLDRIETSTPGAAAPYLHNELLANWPDELRADISPMPECTRPNWLESRTFPSRNPPIYIELYIGGSGARFPVLHYDGLNTHAFLMQLHGVKEYLALAPDQATFVYPQTGEARNRSRIDNIEKPDLAAFPLFGEATGYRFELHPGETLFVPSGWWHTARIVSTSVTVSINTANAPNWKAFTRDYCADVASHSRFKAALLRPYMLMMRGILSCNRDRRGSIGRIGLDRHPMSFE